MSQTNHLILLGYDAVAPVIVLHVPEPEPLVPAPETTGIIQLKIAWVGTKTEFELDSALKDLLKEYGLECWAEGFDFETNRRDMAFEPVEEEK